jgi:hypothetical protein
MTSEQKKWLDANPEYQPIGQPGGNVRLVERGTLKADGTFVPVSHKNPLPQPGDSGFGVAKRQVFQPGQPAVAANDPKLSGQKPTPPGLHRNARRVDEPAPDDPPPADPRGYLTTWTEGAGGLPSQSGVKHRDQE